MDIFGVAYTSRSSRPMLPVDLDNLLVDARANNAAVGITGVLLYGDGRFFQYFEGTEQAVSEVYARIRNARSHRDLVELEYRKVSQRLFRKWFMGFREAPASMLQKLSQLQWSREQPWVEDHLADSAGMQELLRFLNQGSEESVPS